jgi:hypothetical protein
MDGPRSSRKPCFFAAHDRIVVYPNIDGLSDPGRILDEQKNPLNRFLIAALAACWNAYRISRV